MIIDLVKVVIGHPRELSLGPHRVVVLVVMVNNENEGQEQPTSAEPQHTGRSNTPSALTDSSDPPQSEYWRRNGFSLHGLFIS